MPRRVTVPDDLFRRTAMPAGPAQQDETGDASVVELASHASPGPAYETGREAGHETGHETGHELPARRTSSGRVRHDEKVTVYVTSEELLDIEHARLEMRRHHGLAVDRGRIVRAAVALALADLDEHGEASQLVQRLSQQA